MNIPQRYNFSELHSPGELGSIIRQTRKDQGLTQSRLAQTCGTSQKHISELEAGKVTARFDILFSVLRALGLRIHLERPEAENV